MMCKVSDVEELIKKARDIPIKTRNTGDVEQDVFNAVYKIIAEDVVDEVCDYMEFGLRHLERVHTPDSHSLDIPTKCDGCFAQRSNGTCWYCAFTGDTSETGFFQKYKVMENCPFIGAKMDVYIAEHARNNMYKWYKDFVEKTDEEWEQEQKHMIIQKLSKLWDEQND